MQDSKLRLKKILRSVGFFLTVMLVLELLSFVCDPLRLGLQNEVSERDRYVLGLLTEPEDTVDVVVLGDSESYTFMSPMHIWEHTGITSYIGGQAGQRVPETYYSLKRIMKRQSPKLLVLETNMISQEFGSVERLSYMAHEIGYYYFPIIKYHNIWKQMVERDNQYPEHYNGFEIRTDVSPYTGGPYMHETNEQVPIGFDVRFYMNKIKKLCDKNSTQLLFVTAPSAMNHTMQKHNAVKAYAEELQIPYIDLNMETEQLGIDWAVDTLDQGDHLNLSGVLKTNAYMEQYLTEHYDLPDHRGEERYASWEQRLEEFKKQLSQN